MSSSQGQNEPSMEEILASIRRIISEDDAEPSQETAASKAGDAKAQEPDDGAAGDLTASEDDVLELTQMLDADGNVVDLTQMDADEPEADDALANEAISDDGVSGDGGADDALPDSALPGNAGEGDGDVEVEFEDTPGAWPELTDPAPAAEDTPGLEEEAEDEQGLDDETAFATPEPEQETPDMMTDEPTADEAQKTEGLVSRATATAAALALSEVSRNARLRGDLGGVAGSPTLDAIVREALEPYLKSWLDEHLPALVERVVREEVRRLARRVEDE
jgi:cell pole-organizing protein PopZ